MSETHDAPAPRAADAPATGAVNDARVSGDAVKESRVGTAADVVNDARADAADAPVLLRDDDDAGVTTLTLNRPAQFNALNEALLAALAGALDEIAASAATRVVVITGAGRAFCAGHDLREMRAKPAESGAASGATPADTAEAYYRALFARCSQVMLKITHLPQPVIASVNGVATAAGCQLVATCDLAVAAADARFGATGINLGLFCSTPAVALSRALKRKDALELLLTGALISAARAHELGLVNRVVPPAALTASTRALAAEIAGKSPHALRLGKRMFYEQIALPQPEALAYAGDLMAANMMEADAEAGIAAFLDKS